ncbi:MAG: DUF2461 domain-containing protein [Clostridia bacterium]|nr:DUF2461 domain-containing protein [Clostridia bacterium]
MCAYSGISQDSLFLLQINRFNDSKAFYEENKEKIKQGVTVPMRQIAAALSDDMLDIDPMMNTIPTKMVSRVRRDTRYTKDKRLYRENMWIMFMRPKHEWRMYPCMWFEVTPKSWFCGVGNYDAPAELMEIFRRHLVERKDEFFEAVKSAESTGARYRAELYRRSKPNCPDGLEQYYNAKYFCFIFESADMDMLSDEKIIEDIRKKYKKFAPMYNFLKDVSDEYVSKGGNFDELHEI